MVTATAQNNLALCLKAKGEYEEAETLHLNCIEARGKRLGPAHEDTIVAMHNLAELYRAVVSLSINALCSALRASVLQNDILAGDFSMSTPVS